MGGLLIFILGLVKNVCNFLVLNNNNMMILVVFLCLGLGIGIGFWSLVFVFGNNILEMWVRKDNLGEIIWSGFCVFWGGYEYFIGVGLEIWMKWLKFGLLWCEVNGIVLLGDYFIYFI